MARPDQAIQVGKRIRRLRLEKGLTQGQLAQPEFSEAYISMLESGRRQASPTALRHIASRLEVDERELRTGQPAGIEVALEIDIQAARHAVDQGRLEEADTTLSDVAKQAKRLDLKRTLARVHELRGLMAERTEGPDGALPHYESAMELWRNEPPHLRAETIAGIARCTQQRQTPQLAVHLLDSYRRELEASGPPDPLALMRTLTAMIYPYFAAGLPEKAAESAREALALEPRVDEPEDLACMHLAVARSLAHDGHYSDALQSLRRAEDIYLAGGWRNRVAKAQINEAIVLAKKEDFEAARDKLTAALEILEESPNRLDEALALNEMAYVSRHLDDLHTALTFLERAGPLLQDSDIIEKAFNERELGLCLQGTDPDIAERHLKQAIDLYRISGNTTELASTFKALGDLYIAQGKSDLGVEAYREGLASVEERSA